MKRLAVALSLCCAMLFGTVGYYDNQLPNHYQTNSETTFSFAQQYLSASPTTQTVPTVAPSTVSDYEVKLFGIVPVKEVSVAVQDPVELIPSGQPFGVKMFTDGAMVVGLESLQTDQGTCCPAQEAGLEIGDLVQKVNGKPIARNEEVAFLLHAQGSDASIFEVLRDETVLTLTLQPVECSDGVYRSGVWIRDSAAGIGTLTFVDPETAVFGGLGHGICDIDTGDILSVGSGELCEVTIHAVQKGKAGIPGELQGVFANDQSIGSIAQNNETGIYGQLFEVEKESALPIGYQQQITTGPAKIRCTLTGNQPQEYDIEIQSIDHNSEQNTQNMVVKITDPDLLNQTGGIVQGMSGSPIIQNGNLIGAVTHVFVNDPTRGYGIFVENMLETAENIE